MFVVVNILNKKKTRFAYENLPSKFQDAFAFNMEVELPPGTTTLVTFRLQIPNINMAWTLWAGQLNLDPPNGFYKTIFNAIVDDVGSIHVKNTN